MSQRGAPKTPMIPCSASGRPLYSPECPQRYTGAIERADGARPFNGYLWPSETWSACHEPDKRCWDSRWNFGIVHLWNGSFAVMGQLWAIERNNRRYSWTERHDHLPRPNNFATRALAIRAAAADLLRTLRSARGWRSSERITRDPAHWATVINWVLLTAHREAGQAEARLLLQRDPLPVPERPTGLPLFDHDIAARRSDPRDRQEGRGLKPGEQSGSLENAHVRHAHWSAR